MACTCKTSLAAFAALFLTLGAIAAAPPAQAAVPTAIATVELA